MKAKVVRTFKVIFLFISFLWLGACGNGPYCLLPSPFCGGAFPLNTQQTTAYGPPWANVVTSSSDWITCFGPYALCFYAECTYSSTSSGTVADCPCFESFGTNFVDINSILNNDVYNETKAFCDNDPAACQEPNQAPVCQALSSGTFMAGADTFSTFSFYQSTQEPIGSTDCTNTPGYYAGCMTAPCFNPTTPGTDGTTIINCECPVYSGPFQLGKDGLTCDVSPLVDSAAYNLSPPPDHCDIVPNCVPDAPAPPNGCGCGLYEPGTTVIPPGSDVNCTLVCEQYDACLRDSTIELGYTCDATLCTTEDRDLMFDACDGLQDCDLSEIFKAEAAAGCSCCGSQLCDCTPSGATNVKIGTLNTEQVANGDTPQCNTNGTLCGTGYTP